MNSGAGSDHVLRAAAWLLLGVLAGLGMDLAAKELLETYSLEQFILLRSGIAIGILLVVAPRFGGFEALRTKRPGWHVLRTALAIGAMFGFFYGLSRMPLVNALTLGYTAPLMVTALSAIFLGDRVGVRRWIAVIVGFGGVLIMLRPGSSEFSFAVVAVLLAAFFYASQSITARHLGDTETTLSLSFYIVVGPFVVALALIDSTNWTNPDLVGWILMFTAAACSVIAWVHRVVGVHHQAPTVLRIHQTRIVSMSAL